MTSYRGLALLVLFALSATPALAYYPGLEIYPLAVTGEPIVPGGPAVATFNLATRGANELIHADYAPGQTGFGVLLTGSAQRRFYDAGSQGHLVSLYEPGQALSGGSDLQLLEMYRPRWNASGDLVATARLMADGVERAGLITGRAGSYQLVAIEGGPLGQGGPTANFFEMSTYWPMTTINASGQVLFSAETIDTQAQTIGNGVWLWDNGQVSQVAHSGQAVPGYPAQTFLYEGAGLNLGAFAAGFGDDGRAVIGGHFLEPTVGAPIEALFVGGPGTLAPVVLGYQPVPDQSGERFRPELDTAVGLQKAIMDFDTDTLVFQSGLFGKAGEGVFAWQSGTLETLAMTNAPQLSDGHDWSALSLYGFDGENLTLRTNDGVWFGPADGLEQVVAVNQPAPGAMDLVMREVWPTAIGADGLILLTARINTLTDSQADTFGLWLRGPDGVVDLLTMTGDPLMLRPDDERTLASFAVIGPFNATFDESFSLVARFDDGSEALLRVVIPEPATLALLGLGGLLLRRRR